MERVMKLACASLAEAQSIMVSSLFFFFSPFFFFSFALGPLSSSVALGRVWGRASSCSASAVIHGLGSKRLCRGA